MAKELTYDQLWQPAFDPVWNEISPFILGPYVRGNVPPTKVSEVFMSGGRGGGKSYTIAVWIVMALMNDKNKNAVVLRKVASSIRKSCFKQMKKALRKLRQTEFWDVNKTDLTMTNIYTGQQIVFLGLDDEDKVRSITTDVGYFSIVWLEEARQFNGMEEIRQAKSSILRGSSDDDDIDDDDEDEEDKAPDPEYMTFYSYNPPKSARAWINKERNKIIEGRIYNHSTYLTMPVKWLGEGFIREAEALKKSDPEAYEHQYLGKITGTGGNYFTKVILRPISDEEIEGFDYDNMGMDFGTKDPNIFERSYYDDETDTIYAFHEVYQAGENDGEATNPERYDDFAKEVYRELPEGRRLDIIFCDKQGKAERAIMEKNGLNVEFAPKHGSNDRLSRYGWLRSKTIVCDPARCPVLADELTRFECKELPNDEGWTDIPGTKDDHGLDALGYSYWQEIMTEGSEAA